MSLTLHAPTGSPSQSSVGYLHPLNAVTFEEGSKGNNTESMTLIYPLHVGISLLTTLAEVKGELMVNPVRPPRHVVLLGSGNFSDVSTTGPSYMVVILGPKDMNGVVHNAFRRDSGGRMWNLIT